MASVRASIVKQARLAASALPAGVDGVDATDCPAIDQLLRRAELSEDAGRTLEWAFDTLHSHSSDGADELACQLLQAARARLAAQPVAIRTGDETAPARSVAWV